MTNISLGAGVSGQFRPTDNFRAAVAPATTDDASKGYEVGSLWVDTVTKFAYICVDNSAGAASWTRIN